jgi:hypothetical protein
MLDVLDLPEEETAYYVVLPFLTSWDDPESETIGEALKFLGNYSGYVDISGSNPTNATNNMVDLHYQGLEYMRGLNVAHRRVI